MIRWPPHQLRPRLLQRKQAHQLRPHRLQLQPRRPPTYLTAPTHFLAIFKSHWVSAFEEVTCFSTNAPRGRMNILLRHDMLICMYEMRRLSSVPQCASTQRNVRLLRHRGACIVCDAVHVYKACESVLAARPYPCCAQNG